jgi:hypothetical protein
MILWTRWAATLAALFALSGCMAGFGATRLYTHNAATSRPHPSYYCYDCHGDRYFDPYYDWCAGYGFRYAWGAHPEVVGLYRQRYLAIKQRHPEYGHYRYRSGYRETRRYREPADYDAWRRGESAGPRDKERVTGRAGKPEQKRDDARKKKDREREDPRGPKPRDSSRGGV